MPDLDSVLDAMTQVESGGNPNAVSPKGARGLLQIMPGTAKQYGVDPNTLFDPKVNRQLASRIMQDHMTRYGGDLTKSLQAYNAGPGRVASGMIPRETRSYVDKILGILGPSSAEAAEPDYWSKASVPDAKASAPADDYWEKAKPAEPEMRSAQDSVGNFTARVANFAQDHLERAGVNPDWAEGVGRLIENAGPHSVLDAVLQGLSFAVPGVAEFAPESAEAIPYIGRAIEALKAPGLKGAATRAALTGAGGAVTGAVTGETTPLGGAVAGATQSVAGELPSAGARRMTGLGRAEEAGTAERIAGAAESGAQAGVSTGLGMSRQRGAELARPTAIGVESGASELQAGKSSLIEQRQARYREIGQQYDPIYQPLNAMPVERDGLTDIANASTQALGAAQKRNQRLSRSTHDILSELEMYQPAAKPQAGLQKVTSAEIELPGGEKVEAPPGASTFVDVGSKGSLPRATIIRPRNIQELRGMMTRIMQEANRASATNADRSALFEASKPIRTILDNAIPDEMKPALKAINAKYAQVSKIFPFKDVRLLNSAATLPELGEIAFERIRPSATSLALAHMGPAEKDVMRQAFAARALDKGKSVGDVFKFLEQNRNVLPALGFPPELSKVGGWYELAAGRKAFDTAPTGATGKAFMEAFRNAARRRGITPEIANAMDEALRKGAQGKLPYLVRYAAGFGAIGAMQGWGLFGHMPEAVIPIAAYAAGTMGLRSVIMNPELLPVYRAFITNGWTRAGGDAFGRLMTAGMGNFIRQYVPLRPDKQAQAEEANP